jgi:hypothetical protein
LPFIHTNWLVLAIVQPEGAVKRLISNPDLVNFPKVSCTEPRPGSRLLVRIEEQADLSGPDGSRAKAEFRDYRARPMGVRKAEELMSKFY